MKGLIPVGGFFVCFFDSMSVGAQQQMLAQVNPALHSSGIRLDRTTFLNMDNLPICFCYIYVYMYIRICYVYV